MTNLNQQNEVTVKNTDSDYNEAAKIKQEVNVCSTTADLFRDVLKQKPLLCLGVGAMKYCSCLLRSCTAALINQWESSREKFAKNQPKLVAATCRIVEFMRKVSAVLNFWF